MQLTALRVRFVFNVVYNKSCLLTEAFTLIAEGWNEIVQSGLTPDLMGSPPLSDDTEILYAVGPDNDLVGFLAFEYQSRQRAYAVRLVYVEPSSRRKGVFKALTRELFARAGMEDVAKITCDITPNNAAATAALKSIGCTPELVRFTGCLV